MGGLALVSVGEDFTKVIRLEILLAAMGANKYLYSKTNEGGVHQLSLKSIRVMNRLGTLFVRYQDANKQTLQNETGSIFAQVIQALFSDCIVKKTSLNKTAGAFAQKDLKVMPWNKFFAKLTTY